MAKAVNSDIFHSAATKGLGHRSCALCSDCNTCSSAIALYGQLLSWGCECLQCALHNAGGTATAEGSRRVHKHTGERAEAGLACYQRCKAVWVLPLVE